MEILKTSSDLLFCSFKIKPKKTWLVSKKKLPPVKAGIFVCELKSSYKLVRTFHNLKRKVRYCMYVSKKDYELTNIQILMSIEEGLTHTDASFRKAAKEYVEFQKEFI